MGNRLAEVDRAPHGAPLEWRVAGASVEGTSHSGAGVGCQDAHAVGVLGGGTLVAVVADGAGSAARAGDGARHACAFFYDRIGALLAGGGGSEDVTRGQALGWLDAFGLEVEAAAVGAGAERRDYACTLLVAVVGAASAVFFQVGDGAMAMNLAGMPGLYYLPISPERGEYANVTSFATDPDVSGHLRFEAVRQRVDEVALFTDGIESLAVRFSDGAVHDPFFRRLFPIVRTAPPGRTKHPRLSTSLIEFLSSDRVNERTDDDKTLVLASRTARVRGALAGAAP